MSLSAQDRRSVWQEHSDSLTRIKSQLTDKRSPVPKVRTPVHGHSPAGKRDHSPYGKYRTTTPPYLPRLEGTPDKGRKLRGNRYEVVPPVRETRKSDSRGTDYDSWGEESDDEPEPDPGTYMPHPYMSAPQVVWGAPFPVYYPPPPPARQRTKRQRHNENDYAPARKSPSVGHSQGRKPLGERYEDVNSSVPSKSKRKSKQNRVHFSQAEPSALPPNGFYGYPGFPTFMPYPSFYGGGDDPYSNSKKNNRYKPGVVDNSMEAARDDVLSDELPSLIHDVVRTTLTEMVDEHMLYADSNADPLESFLTRLLNDSVQEAAADVVKETVKEMARTYVDYKHHEVVFDDLFNDYMDEIGPQMIEDAMVDLIGEDFIEEEVIIPELGELLPEIATEVLTHYDSKVMRKEMKEVSSQAGDRLMENIMLDYVMQLVARQGKVWTQDDHSNKYMDDMISSLLLQKLFGVTVHRRKTIANKPFKKMHQKVVADVALDVCLQQLTASLDEDLADVDEYERGVTDPLHFHNTHSNLFS